MNKNIFKRISAVLLAAVLLAAAGLTVYAADEPIDFERTGSITIRMRSVEDEHFAVGGGIIYISRVAVISDSDAVPFVYTDEFKNCGLQIDEELGNEYCTKVAQYAVDNKIAGKTNEIGEDGSAYFGDLPLGLYIVMQESPAEGYERISPFFVVMPQTDAEGKQWIYDLIAYPKAIKKGDSDTTEKELINLSVSKKWTDDGKSTPTSVKIALLKDDAVVEEVTLSAENNWSHVWSNLDGSFTWKVQEVNVPKGYTPSYVTTIDGNNMTVTITNVGSLIQTGQLKWPVPLLAGSGMLFIFVGWIIDSKERKRHA